MMLVKDSVKEKNNMPVPTVIYLYTQWFKQLQMHSLICRPNYMQDFYAYVFMYLRVCDCLGASYLHVVISHAHII